jgi:hypothetical protein
VRVPCGLLALGAFVIVAAAVIAFRPRNHASRAVVTTSGRMTDPAGARLSMRIARPDEATAQVASSLPIDTLGGRRIEVSGEFRVVREDAASETRPVVRFLVRIERRGKLLLVHEVEPFTPSDVSGWSRQTFVLPVPTDATALSAWVTLRGPSALEARAIRVVGRERIDADAPLASAAQRELDSAIVLVRTQALWRDSVDWAIVEPAVRSLAAGATTPAEVEPALKVLLAELGDQHSFLYSAVQMARYQGADVPQPQPDVRAESAGIGYVRMPGHMSSSFEANRAYASRVQQGLARVAPMARCGWILDLRDDTGGNIPAMLAGLAPFLGPDTVLTFLAPEKTPGAWRRAEAPYTAPEAAVDLGLAAPAGLADLRAAPVAVLTGPQTASAGEAVAVAFRARPGTRFIGARTAGLSTAIHSFPLPSGAALGLAASIMTDRAGARYPAGVTPDDSVPRYGAEAAGVRWLRSRPTCR